MTMLDPYVPAVTDDEQDGIDVGEWVSVPTLTFDRAEAVDAVCDAYHDAAAENWDGEGAPSISLRTFIRACRFMVALPDGTPTPDVDPSPRGSLLFEWHTAPRRRLTVGVGPSDDLAFAAMLGGLQFHGTTPFDGSRPPAVVDLVHRVVGWA